MSLRVSRADILVDGYQEFPADTRFLKIPVPPYLELLGVTPLRPQWGIINALNNPKYRFIVAAVSRRLGKTYVANICGQLVSLVPGCNILIMSPNYQLSQISFDLQRSLIRHFDLEVTRDNAKDKIIELSNGSTIRMGSVGIVESSVGRSYDFIIFDEAALVDGKEAYNVALRPTLDRPNSKALFISTPRGRNNWFAEFYDRGWTDEFPEWASITADYKENPRMSDNDIDEARKSMSVAEFAQEYMADFNQYEGQVWKFDFENCVTNCQELDLSDRANIDVFAGLDIGFRDATAFCVFAYFWKEEKFYLMEEFMDSEMTTEHQAERIQRLIDKYDIDYIYMDSAAQQTRFDLAQLYGISTINAKKSLLDGIGYVEAIVDNNKLFVDQRAKECLTSLDQYQWDPNPNLIKEKPKHNRASHMADAMRYGLYSFETAMMEF